MSAESLALSRIFYASFVLLTGIPTFSWLSANPPGFFTAPPLSVAAWFADFPSVELLRALDVAICLLLLFVLTGFKTTASSISLSLALILGNSFRYSFGKIDHSILADITPAVMAFSGWGNRFSIDARSRAGTISVAAWPVTLLALLLGFGFLSAGLPKLVNWIDFDAGTHGVRSWLLNAWHVMQRRRLLTPFFMSVKNPYFWEAVDWTAVAFEVGFLFSLAKGQLFRAFLLVAVLFHVANLWMLNISFAWHLPVYAVFAPWEYVVPRLPRALRRALDRLGSLPALAALLVLFLPLYLFLERVPVNTAAIAFSHFGLLATLTGSMDHYWVFLAVGWTGALLAALAFAGMPRPPARAPDELKALGEPTVFFDGVCNLCNGFVDFLIRNDRKQRLRFSSLQSEIGGKIARAAARPGSRSKTYDTLFFMDSNGWIHERSDAVLKILVSLGSPFRLFAAFWLVPRFVRDSLYRTISRFRYRLFGKRASCRLPAPEERARFV